MNIQEVFASQYAAGFAMLKNAVSACHDELWNSARDKNRFWRIAYHALFYTDLYLSADEKHFIPWTHHHENYQILGDKTPWPPHHAVKIGEPYTQNEVLEYCARLQNTLAERINALDFERPSGFCWLPFNKLELQMYNIRHLQHHAGQLIDRLRERQGSGIGWIGKGVV
ncbi:hypothetical protein ANT_01630 [Candidatus Moduliflexus flocculans]|uniref:DinB-like domain-containing protein n=1 Tax=Candidatus Moduliflexus flocculans TaxID=1499966 RepID=A0A0S6VSQ9_9BACT|nr:hypothetical protein ANT_01630 [Candidatus Moduliflexus flocculans]